MMDHPDVMTGAAWQDFCRRIGALGERILADDFPGATGSDRERDRAEGFRHLANQVACWLTYAIGHTDARHPLLFRHNDLVYRWGGPNVDQNARRAVIAGDGTYRITGTMGACEEFVLQVKAGEMHTGDARVCAETSASRLGLAPGDAFTIMLSATEQDGNWVEIAPDANLVHVRDYYFDWQAREPATFAIERLDTQGEPKVPLTPARVEAMLSEALRQIEGSIVYWRDYQEDVRATQERNTFGAPAFVPEGVHDILYAHAFIALGAADALVVEVDPSDADLWDVQLYSRGWYESLDFPNRMTSSNHRLAHRDADGHIRLVVAPVDPGVPNWLDTEARDEVMCTMRWWRAKGMPLVHAELVRAVAVREHLPADTPHIDAPARAEQTRRRAAHVARRYRT
jgi:uncharacterized protein DUF1214